MSHRVYYIILILCASLVIHSGCSSTQNCMKGMPSCIEITPPDINLTGERTVIERQVIGDYRELEKDAWIVSSVQTSVAHGRSQQMMQTGDEVGLQKMDASTYLIDSNDDGIWDYSYSLSKGLTLYEQDSSDNDDKNNDRTDTESESPGFELLFIALALLFFLVIKKRFR